MSKHTPGPWRVYPVMWPDDEVTFDSFRILGADNVSPAIVFGGVEEAPYNARLIAAAPELLEALRDLVDAVGTNPDEWLKQPMAYARRAIAKAEGK